MHISCRRFVSAHVHPMVRNLCMLQQLTVAASLRAMVQIAVTDSCACAANYALQESAVVHLCCSRPRQWPEVCQTIEGCGRREEVVAMSRAGSGFHLILAIATCAWQAWRAKAAANILPLLNFDTAAGACWRYFIARPYFTYSPPRSPPMPVSIKISLKQKIYLHNAQGGSQALLPAIKLWR